MDMDDFDNFRAYVHTHAIPYTQLAPVDSLTKFMLRSLGCLWLKKRHSLAILLGLLVGAVLVGCAMSPAERQAAEQAWAARDAERANRGGGGP